MDAFPADPLAGMSMFDIDVPTTPSRFGDSLKLRSPEIVAKFHDNRISMDGRQEHKALGPQPYFKGPQKPVANVREHFVPPLPEPKPLGMTPRNENDCPRIRQWEVEVMEKQRHKNQKFHIKLADEADAAAEVALRTAAKHQRENVLQEAWQAAAVKDQRAQILVKAPSKPGTPVGSPRARQGPKDAKAPPPAEVTAQWQPVQAAIEAERAAIASRESTQRKQCRATQASNRRTHTSAARRRHPRQSSRARRVPRCRLVRGRYASLVSARVGSASREARERESKQSQLATQADNLASRRNAIDAQRAAASAKADAAQRAAVKGRDKARANAAELQKRVLALREKKEAAKRHAWQLQAHPQRPLTPRWNEGLSTDGSLKHTVWSRELQRTAVATNPRPPTVPSPRPALQKPISRLTPA